MEAEGTAVNKSITCFKLPEIFILDKQETKKYFSKFGLIKSFILRPSRAECTVEYEDYESAQRALNSNNGLDIVPTKPEHLQKVNDDYIDPDVQSELQAMLPSGKKPIMETLMKNPFKGKMYSSPSVQKSKVEVTAVTSDPRLVQNAKAELENLIRKPAYTAEEKFAVLDVRDKLYRVMNTKSTDIKSVTTTKGTCKDMCPEKERLMRVARLQVASFEMDDETNTMDPRKAIKQYSRSSADQEIPLPHELRSEETLKATMTYLLHDIMNLCDDENVSIGDWYHFVWDRTRGIRKDITQQELCSLNSVELLEQCARFHIHCSARLVAEDPAIFDQKINDENLTKSLQTLKYMYDDLKLKNIKCPNEAEFRAYVVLLNLNESGNFLWEIKRLEKDILNSQEMRFALDVYFSVALNNYVKFFNLVREASYMNACILLKYFTQIRLKAMFTIMRSYTQRRGTKFAFNLSYLTEILHFENYEATASFLSYYGGYCDLDNDIVNLDPSSFANSQTPYQMERALETVEYKLETPVAEAICGNNELPSPDLFLDIEPHNSFDDNGYLKKEAFYVEDQNGPAVEKDSSVFKVPKESPPVSPAAKLFGSNPFTKSSSPFNTEFSLPQKSNTSNIFGSSNVFGSFAAPQNTAMKSSSVIGKSIFKIASTTDTAPSIFGSNIFAKPVNIQNSPKSATSNSQLSQSNSSSPSSSASNQGYSSDQEATLMEEKRRIEQEQAEAMLRKKLAEKAQQEQERRETQERLERQKKEEVERQLREAEERKQKKLQQDSQDILDSLLDEVVTQKVQYEMEMANTLYVKIPSGFYDALEHDVVVEQLIKIYQQEHLSFINTTKRTYETMFQMFEHWRKTATTNKRKREKLSSIGCTALNKSLEDHANAILHPQQTVTLANMKQYLSGSPQQVTVPDFNVQPVDLFKDLYIPPMNLPSKLFWKILISLPFKNEEKSFGFSGFIKKWTSQVFNVSDDSNPFYIKHGNLHHSRVAVCLRRIQGIECADENHQKMSSAIDNTNSLIFFCTMIDMNESRKRLNNILDRIDNTVSVTIIVYKNVIDDADEELIRTYFDLSMEPKVNNFEISLFYECREKVKDLRMVVLDGCQFLYDCYIQQLNKEYSELYNLEMQHLFDFFQFFLGDEMWQRVEYSCRDSKEFNSHISSFNHVIQLYNMCLEKLIGIVSVDYKKLPTVPEEFRSALPLMEVRIPHSFEYFPANWKQVDNQKKLISFLKDMKLVRMGNDRFESFKDFQQKLQSFLDINIASSTCKIQIFSAVVDKIVQHFYLMQLGTSEKIDNAIDRMRWLKIFDCIVVGKFNEIYQLRQQNLPNFVIYSKKDIRKYTIPWWYVSCSMKLANHPCEPSNKKAKLSQNDLNELRDIGAILKKGRETLMKASDMIKNSRENKTKTREDSKEFDQYLYKCEEKFRGMKRTLQDKFKD